MPAEVRHVAVSPLPRWYSVKYVPFALLLFWTAVLIKLAGGLVRAGEKIADQVDKSNMPTE